MTRWIPLCDLERQLKNEARKKNPDLFKMRYLSILIRSVREAPTIEELFEK